MKKLLLVTVLSFFVTTIWSQERWQTVYPDPFFRVFDAANANSGMAVVGRVDACWSPQISYVTPEGEELWRSGTPLGGYGQYNRAIMTVDSNLLVTGRTRLSDDILSEDGIVLDLYDRSGNLVKSNKILDFNPGYEEEMPLLELANGHYLVGNDFYFIIVDEELELVARETGFSGILQAETLSDSSFILNDNGSLLVYQNDGTFLAGYEGLAMVELLFKVDGRTLFVGDGNVFELLPETGTGLLLDIGNLHPVNRYSIINDGAILYGADLEGSVTEATVFLPDGDTLGAQLNWVFEQRTLELLISVTGEPIDGYYMVGQDDWEGEDASDIGDLFSAYVERNFPVELDLEDNPELRIPMAEFEVDADASSVFEDPVGIYNHDVEIMGTAMVQNFSSDTVRSLIIFSELGFSFNCVESRYFSGEMAVSIAPFGTEELTFSYSTFITATSPNLEDLDLETCIYVARPNGLLDRDPTNNSNCAIVVDVDDPVLDESEISVYPNPVGSQIQIEAGDHLLYGLRLIDVLGRTIHQQKFSGVSSHQLLREANWPAGQYYLELETATTVLRRPLLLY